jgi:hypothetical protein
MVVEGQEVCASRPRLWSLRSCQRRRMCCCGHGSDVAQARLYLPANTAQGVNKAGAHGLACAALALMIGLGALLRPGDKVQAGGSANAGVCLLPGPRASAKRAAQGSDNLCNKTVCWVDRCRPLKLLHNLGQSA